MRVFKYRGGDEKIFKRDLFAIEKNYFWGSNFKQLNDPCETLISSDKFKGFTNAFVKFLGKNSQNELAKVHEALDRVINQRLEIGIYSLSSTYKDELLWAHYSNSHQGFCIEYDLDLLIDSYPSDKVYSFPVSYSTNPPEVGISDVSDKEGTSIIKKLAGHKSKKWEYEKEHRIIIDKSGEHAYNYKAIKAIYFGLRMPKSWKQEMMTCLNGRGLTYYQMYQVEGKYLFERQAVPDISGNEITYLCQIPSLEPGKPSVSFEIIEKDFNKFYGKATITIELESKTNKKGLTWISNKIKDDLFRKAKRVFISFILKGVKAGDGYWAIASFEEEKLKVSINGLTLEQEKGLKDNLTNDPRDTLGKWIDETPFLCSSLTLLNSDGKEILETKFVDGSKSSEALKSTPLGFGTRYDILKGNDLDEYFIVEKDGTLKYYSDKELFKELRPFRPNKIVDDKNN